MESKKGWIKIVEAFLAVLLIMGVVFVILAGRVGNMSDKEEAMYQLQKTILDEIANDETMRQEVLAGNLNNVNAFVSERLPKILEFETRACNLEDVCGLEEYRENVYANEIVISSTLAQYAPKKLKLFMWEK